MTVKDSAAVFDAKNGSAKPVRRDAVGAEIPVTVHASRTTQGLGKNLPSVHEDTKTVIVLQQGAVVRLTAGLTTGETVVLTNRMTGSDVLCRVGNIKSQPGIQHYVDLEFMQRAPNFWGDAVAAASVPIPAIETPAAAPMRQAQPTPLSAPVAVLPRPPIAVSVPLPVPVPTPSLAPPPASVAMAAPPIAPVAPPPPPPVAVVAPTPILAVPPPPVPTPVADLPSPVTAQTLQPAPLAEPIAPAWKASPISQTSSVTPIRGEMDRSSFDSFDRHSSSGSASGSKKTLVASAAAVALVLVGGAGGYWLFGRPSAVPSAAALEPRAATVTPSPVVATPAAPDLIAANSPALAPVPSVSNTAAVQSQMDVVLESRPDEATRRQSTTALSPKAAAPAPTPALALRRNVVKIEQLKAPKAKAIASRGVSEPPPVMTGAGGMTDAAASSTLLLASAAGPAPPPLSVGPAAGGQLQQPQLLSSVSVVYPPSARMQHVQGVVVLDALVDETGKVTESKVIAGPAPLIVAAQDSLRRWKYKAAQLNGKPIAVHTRVSIKFSLE